MGNSSPRNVQEPEKEAEPGSLRSAFNNLVRLNKVSDKIVRADEPDRIWDLVHTEVTSLAETDRVSVYLGSSEGNELEPWGGDQGDILPELKKNQEDVLQWARREGRVTPVPVQTEEDGEKTIFVIPLSSEEKFFGFVFADLSRSPKQVPKHLQQQIRFLANQAAAALNNLYLRNEVREQLEQNRQTRNRLRNILESINSGIIVIDSDGIVTQFNRNVTAILNVSAIELKDRSISDVLSGRMKQVVKEVIEEVENRGFTMERMVDQKLAGGEEIPVAVGGAPLTDESDRGQGIILLFRDMTASRELERLRKIDKMKSDFVANVSHELRTPLTSIKAYTDALKDMVEGEEKQEFLEVVEEESDRLLKLIDDLLNLSKIQSGEIDLERETFHMLELIEEVIANQQITTDDHELILEDETERDQVYADRSKIEEVLDNLIGNAVKYSPDGGDVVTRVDNDENYLRVSVSDSGIGLTEEEQEKIFDQFYRGATANRAQIQGTGLGLTITKNIIDSHGGEIDVESTEGEGTTFTVQLPLE